MPWVRFNAWNGLWKMTVRFEWCLWLHLPCRPFAVRAVVVEQERGSWRIGSSIETLNCDARFLPRHLSNPDLARRRARCRARRHGSQCISHTLVARFQPVTRYCCLIANHSAKAIHLFVKTLSIDSFVLMTPCFSSGVITHRRVGGTGVHMGHLLP